MALIGKEEDTNISGKPQGPRPGSASNRMKGKEWAELNGCTESRWTEGDDHLRIMGVTGSHPQTFLLASLGGTPSLFPPFSRRLAQSWGQMDVS